MITTFRYGTADKDKLDNPSDRSNCVAVDLRFRFAIGGEKLEADEYETLVKIASDLKTWRNKVAKRVGK